MCEYVVLWFSSDLYNYSKYNTVSIEGQVVSTKSTGGCLWIVIDEQGSQFQVKMTCLGYWIG